MDSAQEPFVDSSPPSLAERTLDKNFSPATNHLRLKAKIKALKIRGVMPKMNGKI